jgi:hypothetical protein
VRITIIDGSSPIGREFSEYRWPLLLCGHCVRPSSRVSARAVETVSVLSGDDVARGCYHQRLIQGTSRPSRRQRSMAAWSSGSFCGSRPELKLVAVAAAPMAIVAAQRHVHRERAAMARRGGGQRTASLPLHPRSFRGLEAEQVQHLLHRDLPANCLEVDTGHGCSSLADGVVGCSRTVPVPFISRGGTGTIP